jgi:flagellar basal body-associated protein FliL
MELRMAAIEPGRRAFVSSLVALALTTALAACGGGAAPAPEKGGKDGAATAKGAKDGKDAGKDAKGALHATFGPTYLIKDRIVNLADPGGRRYLRFSVAIEFEPHEDPTKKASGTFQLVAYQPDADDASDQPTAAGAKDPDKAFQAHIKKYVPAIEDAVVGILSTKTYDEIRTAEGKEAVRRQIRDRVQAVIGDAEHVSNVYFTEFVVQ